MYRQQFETEGSSDVAQKLIESIPAGRVGKPEEIASGIAFLLSDEASYISGQILPISGAS